MNDLTKRLRENAKPLQHLGNEEEALALAAFEAADEIERLQARVVELEAQTPSALKEKLTDAEARIAKLQAEGFKLRPACKRLHHIVSRIDYTLSDWKNALEVSTFDVDFDDIRVLAAVETLKKDAERYRWLRQSYAVLCQMATAKALGLDLSKIYVNTKGKFDLVVDNAMAKEHEDG